MIDISRGFKQVSLPDDFEQKSLKNWKLLPFAIKVLKSQSRKVKIWRKSYDLCISPRSFRFGVMDIILYNELNLRKGNHIAILSHL
jgi:hypothetical protein